MLLIFSSVVLGLFVVAFALQIVGCIKKNTLLINITKPFLTPLILTFCILYLIDYLPDSLHIMIYVSIALAFATAGTALSQHYRKPRMIFPINLCYSLSNLSYIILYVPSFKLFYLNALWIILTFLVYGTITAVFFIKVIRLHNLNLSLPIFAHFSILMFLNFTCLLNLFGDPKLYSLVALIGTLLLIFSNIVMTRQFIGKESRRKNVLSILTYVMGELVIAESFMLMIA